MMKITLTSWPARLGICLVLTLCCIFHAAAQQSYVVTANTSLRIRISPNAYSSAIGSYAHGDTVRVYNLKDGWAEVRHKGLTGYVSAEYIRPAPDVSGTTSDRQDDTGRWDNLLGHLPQSRSEGLFWVMVALGAVVSIIQVHNNRNPDSYHDRPSLFHVASVLFLALCVCELTYFITYTGDKTWFCSPDRVGWMATLVNFILFAIVLYLQVMAYTSLLHAADYHGRRSCDYRWGLYGGACGVVAAIVSALWFKGVLSFILIGTALTQVAQLGLLVYHNIKDGGSVPNLIYSLVLYVVGFAATLVTFLNFLPMLIFALLAFFVLAIFGGGRNRYCRNCRSYDCGYCHYRNRYVNPGDCCNKHQLY